MPRFFIVLLLLLWTNGFVVFHRNFKAIRRLTAVPYDVDLFSSSEAVKYLIRFRVRERRYNHFSAKTVLPNFMILIN